MKRILSFSFGALLAFSMTAVSCSRANDPLTESTLFPLPLPGEDDHEGNEGIDNAGSNESNPGNNEDAINRNMTIRIGNTNFAVTLEDSPSAKAFAALLPLTANMIEMNGNEKYYDLFSPLPTAASRPGTIRTGDLLLWGSHTVVLFYETFSSSYSYTRLGRVDHPDGLAAALGNGNVTVTFSRP